MNSIAPTYALFLLQEFEKRQLKAELLNNTQLSTEILESGASIPLESFQQLLLNAEQLSPDDPVGLIIGRRAHILTLGPLGVVVATAPNAREGLQALETFLHLHVSYSKCTINSNHRGIQVHISFQNQVPDTERFHTESLFLLIQHAIEMITGEPLNNACYNARHAKPSYHEVYQKYLHSPVTFNNDSISIDLPKEHIDKHSPFYEPNIWDQTLRNLAQRIRELDQDNSNGYRQYILSLLRSSEPPLPNISFAAQRLHLSERSLNRRLQKEGTSFRELKAQVMQHSAEQYLRETQLSVEAIANLLGYQDTANFRRSFRKQSGGSPSSFRRKLCDATDHSEPTIALK